jgi:hypothetical protein
LTFNLSFKDENVKCNLVSKEGDNYILSGHVLKGTDKPGTRDEFIKPPYGGLNDKIFNILDIKYTPHKASALHEHWEAKCHITGTIIPPRIAEEHES